ncbi:MAG: metallophosphoesterase [Clostridia bacterium]|nr:metallophosphoesterase [Clostridia bacterium]
MRGSKIFLPILIILMLSLLLASCENGTPEVSDAYTETPSEAITTEELTVPDETSAIAETDEATAGEVTTEEVTTEELTTGEVTTEEVTTEEATTAIITEDETTSAPEPHVHVWSSWTLSKSAGCVDRGEEKRSCVCGENEIRYTDAPLGHIEGRLITVEKSTCTSSGYGHRICGRCTMILRTETIPVLAHTPYTAVEKATCTKDGFERTSCKLCGSELGYKVLKAFGHTEGRHIVLAKLTCTEDGIKDIICSSCTLVLRTEITKAQGHKEGRTITVEKATCTEKGLQHIICSVCTLILREETVEATGHTAGPWITSPELSTDEISVRQKHCVSCDLLMEEESVKSLALVEAERVAAQINSVSGKNSFTFAALSDMHVDNVYTGYNQIPTKKSCEFAAKTVSILERMVDIEAAVMLGDYTASSKDYDAEHVIKDFEYVRDCFSDLGDYPVAWIRGNHEINYYKESDRPMTNAEIYQYIESNSRGMTVDPLNPTGGYGYIDFPENKIRMIFLNTSDVYSEYTFREGEDAPSGGISSDQLRWFAQIALDFSDKADASEWGIILNSHFPLNYSEDTARILLLLEAYRDGSYGNISYVNSNRYYTVSYDFYGIERAEIICSIHGHSHNFRSDLISSSDKVEPWLWRICIPNVSAGRENECADAGGKFAAKWGDFDENGDPIYYTKCHWDDKLGTFVYDEEDATSYCMITVDRDSRKIYAHYVGTGRDRTFGY